jgi:hypothetical protein
MLPRFSRLVGHGVVGFPHRNTPPKPRTKEASAVRDSKAQERELKPTTPGREGGGCMAEGPFGGEENKTTKTKVPTRLSMVDLLSQSMLTL